MKFTAKTLRVKADLFVSFGDEVIDRGEHLHILEYIPGSKNIKDHIAWYWSPLTEDGEEGGCEIALDIVDRQVTNYYNIGSFPVLASVLMKHLGFDVSPVEDVAETPYPFRCAECKSLAIMHLADASWNPKTGRFEVAWVQTTEAHCVMCDQSTPTEAINE